MLQPPLLTMVFHFRRVGRACVPTMRRASDSRSAKLETRKLLILRFGKNAKNARFATPVHVELTLHYKVIPTASATSRLQIPRCSTCHICQSSRRPLHAIARWAVKPAGGLRHLAGNPYRPPRAQRSCSACAAFSRSAARRSSPWRLAVAACRRLMAVSGLGSPKKTLH